MAISDPGADKAELKRMSDCLVYFYCILWVAVFVVSATLRIAGALSKSTDVMKSMQELVKLPEIQATMRDMSKEMMKASMNLLCID